MADDKEVKAEAKEPTENKPESTDYTKARKRRSSKDTQERAEVHKVVSGEVVVKKPGVGSKIKNLFIAADFKSVGHYVMYDVFIPAARTMIAESAIKGIERTFFGESRFRRYPGSMGQGIMSKITYNSPVQREREGYRDPSTNPPMGSSFPRAGRPDFFLKTKADAEAVLTEMWDVLGVMESVSLAELNTMIGVPSAYTDEKWGWTDLRGVEVRQDRGGWRIDLPAPQPLI